MAIREALASRYPDLDPDSLDRLAAMAGEPVEAPIDPGTAVNGGAPAAAGGGEAFGPPRAVNDLAQQGPVHLIPKDPARGVDYDPTLRTLQNSVKPVDIAARVEGKDPGVVRARLAAEESRGINPTDNAPPVTGGGGGGPIRAGWMPSTRQIHTTQGFSADELEPWHTAHGMRQNEARDRMEQEVSMANRQGVADAAYANAYAEQARVYQGRQAFNEERKQRYVEEEMRKLNELSVATQKEVDPDKFMKDLGGGGQIMAAIAMAMGQFGAALTGGQNAALQIIQGAIDRSVRAQEANVAKAGAAFDRRQNLYGRNLEAFGDREKAIHATRINYLDAVGAELQAAVQNESLPEQQRARAHAMLEKVYDDRAKIEGQYAQYAHNQIQMAQSDRFAIMGGGGAGGGSAKALEHTVTLQDGTTYQIPEDVHKETLGKVQAHGVIDQLDARALKLRQELKEINPVTDRGQYNTKIGELQKMAVDRINTESLAQGQGVVKKDEMEQQLKLSPYLKGYGEGTVSGMARSLVPGVTADRTVGDNLIREQQARSRDTQRELLRSAGASLIDRSFQKDATGNLQPVGKHRGQFTKPGERLAPDGVSPESREQDIPTRGPSDKETTPRGPISSAPAGSGMPTIQYTSSSGKKGRKK